MLANLKSELDALKTPRLEVLFDPTKPPYVHDKALEGGGTLRIFRIGVLNRGATTDVRVRLKDFDPMEPTGSYLGHELAPTGQPGGTMKVAINRSATPNVFFDVVAQAFKPDMPSHSLNMRYAAEWLFGRALHGLDSYQVTLAVDAEGAGEPVTFIVEKDEWGKRWEMRRA